MADKKSTTVSELIAVGSAGAIILSQVYSLGYFRSLGAEFYGLLSITDHVMSAFLWLLLLPVVIVLFFFLAEGSYQGSIKSPYNFKVWLYTAVLAPSAVVIIGYFLFPTTLYEAVAFLFCFAWIASSPLVFRTLKKFYLSRFDKYLILFAPVFLVLTHNMGMMMSQFDMASKHSVTLVLDGKNERIEGAIVFRIIDNGILFRDTKTKAITYMKWSDIKAIEKEIDKSAESKIMQKIQTMRQHKMYWWLN